MNEKDLEKRCCEYARNSGFLAVKLENNHHKGIPDRVIIARGGQCLFVEFKNPNGKGVISECQKYFGNFLAPNFFIINNFIKFTEILKPTNHE